MVSIPIAGAQHGLFIDAVGDAEPRDDVTVAGIHVGSGQVHDVGGGVVVDSVDAMLGVAVRIDLIAEPVVQGQFAIDLPLIARIKAVTALEIMAAGLTYCQSWSRLVGRPKQKSAKEL